jgi:predicted deacylase
MNFHSLHRFTNIAFSTLLLSSALTFAGIESSAEIKSADMTEANGVAIPASQSPVSSSAASNADAEQHAPKAESINLKEVIPELAPVAPTVSPVSASTVSSLPTSSSSESSASSAVSQSAIVDPVEPAPTPEPPVISSKFILGMEVPPNTSTRLVWMPEGVASGLAEQTPVLVVNGKNPGKTLCLTGAVHGDELNGIEMIRRIMYQLDPDKLTGTVIGVPVVNLMGFRRNSRYLPDRRDLNRYFPGNTRGSSASRIAYSFFTNIIRHCDALVDIHTGSFHRTNLTQLRADLSNEQVAALAQSFGAIAVLNSRGNPASLRTAAVRAGIPSVTVEAGEPMRMQSDVVLEGTRAIETLLAKMGMYGRQGKWNRYAPVYYKSVWVRANQSGILFSRAPLGKRVVKGEVLGTVTDPITNASSDIVSPYHGRILGMALDQVVLPGFAAYHIGIQTPEAILIEEGQLDDEDGDDAFTEPLPDASSENPDIFNKIQDMDDEEE